MVPVAVNGTPLRKYPAILFYSWLLLQAIGRRRKLIGLSAILPVLALFIMALSCSPARSNLNVFAAAGAKSPLDEIGREFQGKYGTAVDISYGGGGEVLNQMVLARAGDVYVAPEQGFMATAAEKQAIYSETVKSIAYMVPVIAVPKGNPRGISTLADLARPDVRVAITRPETTLLGKFAPEIFARAGLAEAIGKNIVAEAARPDSLLTMLVMGQVDAGITWHFYRLQAPDDIEVIFLPPEQLTGIGEMQIAVSSYCRDEKTAQRFIDFVTSHNSQEIFEKYGYFTSAEEAKEYWH